MKRIIIAVMATLMVSSYALAQESDSKTTVTKKDKTEMVQNMTNRMVSRYGLNETQAKSLLELNKEYSGKIGPMGGGHHGPRPGSNNSGNSGKGELQGGNMQNMENGNMGDNQRPSKEQMESRMKEVKANMEAYEKGLKSIMTDEQYTKYEQDKQNMHQMKDNKENNCTKSNNENSENK
jgi:hypothetical protein